MILTTISIHRVLEKARHFRLNAIMLFFVVVAVGAYWKVHKHKMKSMFNAFKHLICIKLCAKFMNGGPRVEITEQQKLLNWLTHSPWSFFIISLIYIIIIGGWMIKYQLRWVESKQHSLVAFKLRALITENLMMIFCCLHRTSSSHSNFQATEIISICKINSLRLILIKLDFMKIRGKILKKVNELFLGGMQNFWW